jgi:hypothetical protein
MADLGVGFSIPALSFSYQTIEIAGFDPLYPERAALEAEGYDAGYAAGFADGSASGGTTPVVAILSPAPGVAAGQPGGFPGTYQQAKHTPIVLTISDLEDDLQYVCITATFTGIAGEECVYRNGEFRGIYASSSSAIINGDSITLSVRRDGGWPRAGVGVAEVSFAIDAIDADGNLTSESGLVNIRANGVPLISTDTVNFEGFTVTEDAGVVTVAAADPSVDILADGVPVASVGSIDFEGFDVSEAGGVVTVASAEVTPSVVVSVGSVVHPVDLTALGDLDWLHVGALNGGNPVQVTTVPSKKLGGWLRDSWRWTIAGNWNGNIGAFVTATAADNLANGVINSQGVCGPQNFDGTTGRGFSFRVPGSATPREVRFYCGWGGCNVRVTATIDGVSDSLLSTAGGGEFRILYAGAGDLVVQAVTESGSGTVTFWTQYALLRTA